MSRRNRKFKFNQLPKVPFTETLWTHFADYETGNLTSGISSEGTREVGRETKREEHWGKKQNCAKCRKNGTMGDFTNYPTFRGILIFSTIVLFIIFIHQWLW